MGGMIYLIMNFVDLYYLEMKEYLIYFIQKLIDNYI